jgi:hypothetical protein
MHGPLPLSAADLADGSGQHVALRLGGPARRRLRNSAHLSESWPPRVSPRGARATPALRGARSKLVFQDGGHPLKHLHGLVVVVFGQAGERSADSAVRRVRGPWIYPSGPDAA